MGVTGPIPKRASERRRQNKPATPTTTVKVQGVVEIPEPDGQWHPIAHAWYVSLGESAQSRYYEPSDWAQARIWAEVLSRQLQAGRISGQMMATWQSGANDLLTTEGVRRRARMEIERNTLSAVDEPVTVLDDYRDL
jgi:hypothetical protein